MSFVIIVISSKVFISKMNIEANAEVTVFI